MQLWDALSEQVISSQVQVVDRKTNGVSLSLFLSPGLRPRVPPRSRASAPPCVTGRVVRLTAFAPSRQSARQGMTRAIRYETSDKKLKGKGGWIAEIVRREIPRKELQVLSWKRSIRPHLLLSCLLALPLHVPSQHTTRLLVNPNREDGRETNPSS